MTDDELKELVASRAAQSRETDRLMKKLWENLKKHGNISDDVDLDTGFNAKEFFQNVFEEKPEFGKIKYDEMVPGFAYKNRDGQVKFDIVLLNESSIALINVKNKVYTDFVKNLAEESVQKFKKFFPEYGNYSVYLGIAGFSFDDEVLDQASRYGIGIVRQAGEGIEIEAANLKAY